MGKGEGYGRNGLRKWKQPGSVPRLHSKGEQLTTSIEIAVELGVQAVDGIKAASKATSKAVRKWRNYRPPRWRLLNCPDAEAVNAQWKALKESRDPVDALKFGAMLLNVSQYVDCSPIYGKGKHIVARNSGLKGWLRENCNDLKYVTAMSYRKLAEVTCKAIRLPEFIPLEWVLPGTEALDASRDLNPEQKLSMKLGRHKVIRQIKECRQRLCKILGAAGNVNQLNASLDVVTGGHRYRAPAPTRAERSVVNHLRTALYTLKAVPEVKTPPGSPGISALVDNLRRHIEQRSA